MQRAIRESGNPPDPIRKTIPPSGLTGKNDTPETIPTDFPANIITVGRQTISLGENALAKQTAESKRLRSRKKQRFIFLFYHTKAGKATGRNANMQFVYTAGQAEKQSTVA